MKKVPLHWQIILGIILGVLWGILASETGLIDFTNNWIAPFGKIFVNLLKLIAVPLVMVSLINGVSNMKDISRLSRIGGKTLGIYIVTTVTAITIGLVLVNLVQPGNYFSEDKQQELRDKYASESAERALTAEEYKESGPLKFLVDIVPENIFNASTDNSNMLQIIFVALLFGVAIVILPDEKTKTINNLIEGANEVILKVVDIIMKFAPVGVFALLGGQIVEFAGSLGEFFEGLGVYTLTVVGGLLILIFGIYPLVITLFTKLKYPGFIRAILPAQMLALSTSSSAATLPVTMRQCEEEIGVSEEVSSFVLPLGATINMDGTSLYQSVAAMFIAQAFGFDLTIYQQLTIVLTATLASIGSAAVPGAGIIMLVIVLESIGLDPAGIGLILAMDRPLDMLRTSTNVTGDATVASLVAYSEGELATAKSSLKS